MKKVSDLTQNPRNPRKITDAKLRQLAAGMEEFGDISGVIYNRKTGIVLGGNQRSKVFEGATGIEITKKYPKPTKCGTVAEGFITYNGERFSYREVSWPKSKETAAGIAANKGAGEWDLPELTLQMKELDSFDSAIDVELTMFDEAERKKFEKAEAEVTKKQVTFEVNTNSDGPKKHVCPRCEYEFS